MNQPRSVATAKACERAPPLEPRLHGLVLEERERELLDVRELRTSAELATVDEAVRTSSGAGLRPALHEAGACWSGSVW